MEFLLFLLFLCLTLVFLAGVVYYARILFFHPRDVYNREEIVSIGRAIPLEILRLWEGSGNPGLGALVFLLGGLIPAIWARIGGIIGSPHYAHSPGNYFFHFPLLFLAVTLTYSFWKTAYPEDITKHGYAFSVGLGAGSIAKSLSSYGTYHEMYFFSSFIVIILVSILVSYLWNQERFFGMELPGHLEHFYDDYDTSLDSNDVSDDWADFDPAELSDDANKD